MVTRRFARVSRFTRTLSSSIPLQHLQQESKNTTMALLVDKQRPRSLDKLSYHDDLSQRLKALVITTPPIQSTPLTSCKGTKRRLSTSPRLRTLRRRQEDENRCYPQRALWPWCRKDQNRLSRLPNDVKSQARVQYCRVHLPSRNHTQRCRKLR